MNRQITAALLGLSCVFLLLVARGSQSWFVFEETALGLDNLPPGKGFEITWALLVRWASLLACILLGVTVVVALLFDARWLAISATALLLITLFAGLGVAWGAPRGLAIGFAYPTFLCACLGGLLAAHLARVPRAEALAAVGREQGEHVEGQKHGRWLVYDATNTLVRVDTYDHGELKESTPVGPDGRPRAPTGG